MTHTAKAAPQFTASCRKHPNSSSVGVCAHCLNDSLLNLLCSECTHQRLSSCSCSHVSYRNSCSTIDVGSVGRVSFLIQNDKIDHHRLIPKFKRAAEQVVFLRQSTSNCAEVNKFNGFRLVKRLFRKRWVKNGDGKTKISLSRSLCSFRGGDPDEASECALSSAKISDVTKGIFFDPDKQCGLFHDSASRRSGIGGMIDAETRGTRIEFDRSVEESDFNAMDESAFIDLKLDLAEVSGGWRNEGFENGGSCANLKSKGGYCKGGGRSHKVWKWIFKYPPTMLRDRK